MKQKHETDLGNEPIGRLLFRLSVPAITAQVVNVLYNMVDRMYIGHIPGYGAAALTGVGVAFPLIMLISAFAGLVSMGGAPRASIMMGKGKKEDAEEILGNCAMGLLITGLLLTAFFLLFAEKLLLLFGASANTIEYSVAYMKIYSMGTLFVQAALGLNAFITAQGFATTSMLSVVIGAVSNIILDPILIFGFHMGVKGAALATIISQGISAIWVIHFLCGKKTILRLRRKYFKIRPSVFFPCMALGLSPFIMQSTESILNICFNASLLRYGGDIAVGAMTILCSVMQFSMLPLMGLTQGSQPIVSFNYGAGNPDRVKKAYFILLRSCAVYSTLVWAIAVFAPGIFTGIFTNDPVLTEFTKWAMRIYMSVSCFFSVQIACQQTFIALGKAKESIFLALLRKVILLIPLIYILPVFFQDKTMAVYLAEPVADVLAVSTTATLFGIKFRKIMKNMRTAEKAAVHE